MSFNPLLSNSSHNCQKTQFINQIRSKSRRISLQISVEAPLASRDKTILRNSHPLSSHESTAEDLREARPLELPRVTKWSSWSDQIQQVEEEVANCQDLLKPRLIQLYRSSDHCFAISIAWQLFELNRQYLFFEEWYCPEILWQLLYKCSSSFYIVTSWFHVAVTSRLIEMHLIYWI